MRSYLVLGMLLTAFSPSAFARCNELVQGALPNPYEVVYRLAQTEGQTPLNHLVLQVFEEGVTHDQAWEILYRRYASERAAVPTFVLLRNMLYEIREFHMNQVATVFEQFKHEGASWRLGPLETLELSTGFVRPYQGAPALPFLMRQGEFIYVQMEPKAFEAFFAELIKDPRGKWAFARLVESANPVQ